MCVHVHRSHTQAPTTRSFRHVTLLAPRDSLSILKVFRKKQTQEREITLDDFGDKNIHIRIINPKKQNMMKIDTSLRTGPVKQLGPHPHHIVGPCNQVLGLVW